MNSYEIMKYHVKSKEYIIRTANKKGFRLRYFDSTENF